MTNSFTRSFLLTTWILTTCASPAFSAASFRVVAYLTSQYQQAGNITEISPGVFDLEAPPAEIFSVTRQGNLATLANFQDPPYIGESGPVPAANGLVYSSFEQVINGDSGNLFSVGSKPGTEHVYPTTQAVAAGPIIGGLPDGGLFGLAYTFSNASFNLATLDLKGGVKLLYQFPGTDRPGLPVYHADGSYYGTAFTAGSTTSYLWRVTPSGSFTKVADLPFGGGGSNGLQGSGLLVQATDGNFYGICLPGGIAA